jgi:hypothetical protein
VCPGVITGLKFNLYSLDNVFKELTNIKRPWDFLTQNNPGNQKIIITLLTQFIPRFIHNTFGSKIENKLFIILENIP